MKLLKTLGIIVISIFMNTGAKSYATAPALAGGIELPKEERIVLTTSDMKLTSVRPDGSDERDIDSDVYAISISPDQRWMIAFLWSAYRTANMEAIVYDLEHGVKHQIHLPSGHWNLSYSWWSNDSSELFSYSGLTTDGEPLYPEYGRAKLDSRIESKLTYNISSDKFTVQAYPKSLQKTLREFLNTEYPELRTEWLSPDVAYKLKWETERGPKEKREGLLKRLYLLTAQAGERHLIFEKEKDKFRAWLEMTDHSWSPKGDRFVVSLYEGGFWSALIGSEYKVTVYDTNTFKKSSIARGYNPYWIKKLPIGFMSATKD